MASEQLGILESVLGRYYKSGAELLFKCPKCNHEKRKLSINLDKGAFKCWICGYSGKKISNLVRRFGDRSEYSKWLDLDGSVDLTSFDDLFSERSEKAKEVVSLPESFKTLTGRSKTFSSKYARNYLKKRGITFEDVLK